MRSKPAGQFALIVLCGSLVTAQAAAQDTPPAAGAPAPAATEAGPTGAEAKPKKRTTQVEELVVTGSRIRTNATERPQAVTSISSTELTNTGLVSVGEILQRLPAAGGALNSKFNQSGNAGFSPDGSGTSAGSAEIDLRYLGSKRTLVLVDGLRWVPGSAASGVPAASDLNTIPMAIVDHIEVLADGASAVYGSDAIGGVVNIITKKKIDGIQANAYEGAYQQGDGWSQQYDLAMGSSSERASTVVGVSYVRQDTVWSRDRAISATAVPYHKGCISGFCSSATPSGRWDFYDGQYPGATPGDFYSHVTDLTYAGAATQPFDPADPNNPAGGWRPFTPSDRFDYQPYNMMLTPSDRFGAFTQMDYRLTDNVHASAKLLFNTRASTNQAAPEPLFLGGDAGTHTRTDLISIDATQIYNPFHQNLDNTGLFVGRRAVEAGPRIFEQNVNTWYASGGFNGSFNVMDRQYTWDVTALYSRNRADQTKFNGINAARLQKALGPASQCGPGSSDESCVPVDIFGANTMTPAMLAYITYQQHDLSQQQLWDVVANLSGDLVELPAGPLGIALGIEHRDISGFFRPDAIVSAGDTADVPAKPTSGSYYANEAYLEALVPVLSDIPGAELLDLTGAVRVSDYSTFGTEGTFKAGLRWRPTSDFLIRGSVAQGFRAPSIGELYGSPGRYDATVTDPCNAPDAASPVPAACTAVWGAFPVGYQQNNPQISVTTGGSKDLKAETSLGFTAGIVFSPKWFPAAGLGDRLDVELGYFNVKLDNAVATDPLVYLSQCLASTRNPATPNGDPLFCGQIKRTNGQITTFDNFLRNIGSIATSGFDWAIAYVSPAVGPGHLRLDWSGNYLVDFTESYPATGGKADVKRVGTEIGDPERGFPRLKSNAMLSYIDSQFMFSWGVRYLSGITANCDYASLTGGGVTSNCQANGTNDFGNVVYNDIEASFSPDFYDHHFSVTLGVNNLFNKEPPACYSCSLNNFDASLYDVPGRFGFVRAGYRM